jgi:hypothetical protein
MDKTTIDELEQIAESCQVRKLCATCGEVYTEVDNLGLPCSMHPGEPIGDSREGCLRVWSCCAEAGQRTDRTFPCTRSVHRVVAGGIPPPTVVVLKEVIESKTAYEAAHAASGAVVVESERDLERAVRTIGDELRGAPCYGAIFEYVGTVARGLDECRYFCPTTESESAIDEAGPRRALCIVVARSREPCFQLTDVPSRLQKLAVDRYAHILFSIWTRSPNPHTAAAARALLDRVPLYRPGCSERW